MNPFKPGSVLYGLVMKKQISESFPEAKSGCSTGACNDVLS